MNAPIPSVCSTCHGDGFVEVVPLALPAIVEVPCPTCHCPCGAPSPGGPCEQCRDEIAEDTRHRRRADV